MNIVLVISDMRLGGAQRVISQMSNFWAEKGHRITIVTLDDGSVPPAFRLHDEVRLWHLGLRKDSGNPFAAVIHNIKRIGAIKKALHSCMPDIVLSSLDTTNIKTIPAARCLGIPVVVTEHTDPGGRSIGRFWECMRRLTYPWADAVVCLGERPLSYFGPRIRRRGVIIPNPVSRPNVDVCLTEGLSDRKEHILASMGSLRSVKGFDILLNAFDRVASRHRNWRLIIWGEGPLRSELEAQKRELPSADRISLPGVTSEPHVRLSESDMFVLPSRVEGWGLALCEAMAVGLPVIATDTGAVSDVVRNGVDGLLVPPDNVDALTEALDQLMASRDLRAQLAARSPEIVERFSVERVMNSWEELIRKLTGKDLN